MEWSVSKLTIFLPASQIFLLYYIDYQVISDISKRFVLFTLLK